MRSTIPVALATTLLTAAPLDAADMHGAHRHGAAEMNVALQDGELSIDVEGPAENVLGFEHAPKNETQKQTLARAQQLLREPQRLFALPAAAGCTAAPARVEIKLPPRGGRDTHAEFEAEYRWRCAAPATLRHIDVEWFKAFPRLRALHAQIVTGGGQRSATLKAGAARLALP